MIQPPISDIAGKFKELVVALNDMKARKGATQVSLVGLLNMSKTQVAELLNGNLMRKKDGKRNFSDAVITRLHADFVLTQKPVEISTFTRLYTIAKHTQATSGMTCVVGKTGTGKSTTLKYILREQANTYYILANHLSTPLDMFEAIQQTLGIKPVADKLRGKARKKALIESISDHVNRQDKVLTLILDDMHHFGSIAIYQDLKWLYDLTEGSLALILVGTPNLEENLKRWAGYDIDWNEKYKPKSIMPEFVRRFKGDFQRLPALCEGDLKQICLSKNVKDARIWKHCAKKPNLDLGTFTADLDYSIAVGKQKNIVVSFELMP